MKIPINEREKNLLEMFEKLDEFGKETILTLIKFTSLESQVIKKKYELLLNQGEHDEQTV